MYVTSYEIRNKVYTLATVTAFKMQTMQVLVENQVWIPRITYYQCSLPLSYIFNKEKHKNPQKLFFVLLSSIEVDTK